LYQHVSLSSRAGYAETKAMYSRKGECKMPILFIEAPPGIRPEAKRKMMEKITAAVDEAYHIGDTLIFLNEHSIENVAMDGRIQSENPKILEALKKVSAGV
jgi:phenylpyruvate tautomerase PptA (4-oxalocrotonate tautomerase family)